MDEEEKYVPTEEDNFQAWVAALPEKQSAVAFQGDADAILQISDNADQGIFDLVDAYKSAEWDNPELALQTVKTYADKLRQKVPGEQNLLSPAETMELAPVKPKEVDDFIEDWELINKEKIKNSKDPLVRAYEDLLTNSITDVATQAFQQANVANDESQFFDKVTRTALGAIPGLIKSLGREADFERNLRADSNDTLASAVSSGVGSILSLPIVVPNLILNTAAFGKEQYDESRSAGASIPRATASAAIEGANQAADVILDKLLLGSKKRKAAGFVVDGLRRSLGEGTQEYLQNKISEVADVVGLSKDEYNAYVTEQDALAFAAGTIIGGGAKVLNPELQGPSKDTSFIDSSTGQPPVQGTTDLSQQLGLTFPETQPPLSVAVVGEPVAGGANVTTVEDASKGEIGVTNTEPITTTDAGEMFLENTDGTTSRVVDGAKKQAHTGAIVVDDETANKIANIQATEPNGQPIVVRHDDLNRPYIDHPNVGPDLTVTEQERNTDPVMIPESSTGHVLQYSEKTNELGSVEHSATLSQAPVNGISAVGAQQIKESSIADKLRGGNLLNPNVRALLGLNEDFSTELSYVPNTNSNTMRLVNDVFSKFDNNYVAFANDLLNKDYADISTTEAVAAAFAGNGLSQRAEQIRAENPQAAEQYDILAANLWAASQKVGTAAGQELQMRSIIPVTGNTIINAVRSESNQIATVRAAEEANISPAEVENVVKENVQLDRLDQAVNEREGLIQEAEKAAEEIHDAPDKAVQEIEKQLSDLDTSSSPEIAAAEEDLKTAERAVKESEGEAQRIEKEADTIETAQEKANDKVEELSKKIDELDKQVVEVKSDKVDALKEKKAALPKPVEAPKVKAAQEKVRIARDVSEKSRAKIELEKALNEEKARGVRERAAIEEEIRKAEEEQAAEKKRLREEKAREIKAVKEELAAAKKEAQENKKAEVLAKRKQANEIRAENKRIRAEKEEALREARKTRQAELVEAKKQKREQLNAAKAERTASRQLRKEQLALEREKLKAQKEALKGDREKINQRRARNKQITDSVERYKKEFQNRLTPEQTTKINALVQMIQNGSGLTKKKALEELGKTIAEVKGVDLIPGSDPLSTFWQSNVLFSLGTNTANVIGNFTNPIRQVVADLATGKPGAAFKFIRGWTKAIFSTRTLKDTAAGFRGELSSRNVDKLAEQDLKDLATGTVVIHENDPVKSLQKTFGTGKLGKFLSSPAITLRMLGAMDAIFSRASREGRLARETKSYAQYLEQKAQDFNKFSVQAKNEEAQLKSLGVEIPKNFVAMRADELSFESRPEEQRERISRAVKKDVFQEEGGPRGLLSKGVANILNATAGAVKISRTETINPKWTIASALGFSNRVLRDNATIDKVYPLVARGVSQGKTLVVNGKEVKGGTKEILASLLDAVTKKQVISLRGDSIRPFKYVSGMFVSTSSQILDMSAEAIPGVGYLDKRFGGKWHEYTADEKAQLYGTQIASTILVGTLLSAFLPNMDDEEGSSVYVYGGMRDEKLRKFYEAKGIKPFSLRVGNRTVSYKDIPGLNLILGGIGELSDSHMVAKRTPERPITVGSSMQSLGVGALYAASQLSLLKNVGTLADFFALQDTQAANSAFDVVTNIGAGFVPYSGGARELERFVYGDLSRPKNVQSRMLQNIPFAKFVSDNKPALNIFGEPLRAHVIPGVNRFIGDAKDSFEIDWLLRNGYTVSLPKAGNALTKKQLESYSEMQASEDPENFEPYLTEEDQRTYMEQVGPELKAILAGYANSDPQGFDPQVQKKLDRDIKKMKARVKKQILQGE